MAVLDGALRTVCGSDEEGRLRLRKWWWARTAAALATLLPALVFGTPRGARAAEPETNAQQAAAPAGSAVRPEDDYAEDIQGNVPGASAIEGRLMAPCCWTQTIDIHDSEIALSMRHEIRRRLRNGESEDAIQASFVERYGPKILAVQPNSQLKNVFIGLAFAMALAGVIAFLMLRRWRLRALAAEGPATKRSENRDQWDERLDAELRDLERD